MNTKWLILGCVGVAFLFTAIVSIGGVILWHVPEVREIFFGSQQPPQQSQLQPSQQSQQQPSQQSQQQPVQYNSSDSQQQSQNKKQKQAPSKNKTQNQTQTHDSDDEDLDNIDVDDTGIPDKDDGKIYDGFDDFNNPDSKKQNKSVKLVRAHGIQTVPKSYGGCNGLAPAEWAVSGAENNVAIGIDFRDSQILEGATYMVIGVTTYIDAYGNDFYGSATPERYIQTTLTALGISGFQYISQGTRLNDGYVLLFWQGFAQGQPVRGFAHYMGYPTGNQNLYVLALRYGFTPANQWEKRMNIVYDVAASARCQKRLFP